MDGLLRGRTELRDGGISIDVGLHAAIYDPDHVTADELAAAQARGRSRDQSLPGLSGTRDHVLRPAVARADGHGRPVRPGRRRALRERFAHHRPWRIRPPRPASLIPGRGLSRAPGHPRPRTSRSAVCSLRRRQPGQRATSCTCPPRQRCVRSATRGQPAWRPRTRRSACTTCCSTTAATTSRTPERYLVCPPLRARSDIEALWAGLGDETIGTIGSDHCQSRTPIGDWLASAGHQHAYGLAGIGPRLPLLLSAAVTRGLTLPQVVEARCREPGPRVRALPAQRRSAAGVRRRRRDL